MASPRVGARPRDEALHLTARALTIPLRTRFRHATAERSVAESVWVEASRGPHLGLGEGCPRSYVTGETLPGALAWTHTVLREVEAGITDLSDLRAYVASRCEEIERHPAAWCAIELALLDLLARERGEPIEELLHLPHLEGSFHYTAVVGAEDSPRLDRVLETYLANGFWDFKVKVTGDEGPDRRRLRRLREMSVRRAPPVRDLRMRIDANNAWAAEPSRAIDFLASLEDSPFAVEEPLAPRARDALLDLAARARIQVILDESLCTPRDVQFFAETPGPWIGNVRVSKMGGLLRALEVVDALVARGIPVIVGAHVGETSVLTRAELTVARAAQGSLIAQEGAFGELLIAQDPVEPSLSFGKGGALELPRECASAGFGLRPRSGAREA